MLSVVQSSRRVFFKIKIKNVSIKKKEFTVLSIPYSKSAGYIREKN